jgi:hypothetical protein
VVQSLKLRARARLAHGPTFFRGPAADLRLDDKEGCDALERFAGDWGVLHLRDLVERPPQMRLMPSTR